MEVDILVPTLGESIATAQVAKWLKKIGDNVKQDEIIVELETDKVALEVPAPANGRLQQITQPEGSEVPAGAVLGKVETEASATMEAAPAPPPPPVAAQPTPPPPPQPSAQEQVKSAPSARASAQNLSLGNIKGSGLGGAVTRADVAAASTARPATPAPAPRSYQLSPAKERTADARGEEVVPMSRLRQRIAERLTQAQQTAALLTTFNEIDMGGVIALRQRYKERFERKQGVKLGFMSFFVRASAMALREFPEVNAELNGTEVIYKNYCDIGVAVSVPQGLVVPVLRDAQDLSFAEIERRINDFATRARDSKLSIEDLQGGTFTITNGGVFGSLLSTPIVNAPQSAILGMHSIEKRPVVRGESIVVASMMYAAVTYDHRLIDGRGAVSFLKRVKDLVESPERLLLDV